ncbi:phosphate-repressible phosphate permease-like protein [Cucurbitaria berberidis CBS 394.84]|uniref:Phosphate transporter n=1 Tax=Cucurbitaria berberidis CBS 394.84 TaxID=1168544 RepID=A0A9P4GLN1_9PLEO|nr:phosphate-repressible phosphate permease-like protein [Cucurbitaria berberidis CBS 394.84]KAF1847937.1 phosphate-repressible phosphate permease-like protein [Cucurbitaria berberidis CBS 394.84]
MVPAITARYDWILAITTIAFVFSAFGNGANDVANSYATSVAAQTLTMPQVGFLSIITEFVGAVALGARVTDTIKNGIINIDRFQAAANPGTLMLAMGCAEVGSATWLMFATRWGLPVSTTQTVVGALVGVGLATRAGVTWGWESGSVSQVAASWVIAPLIACAFSAIIFGTVKYAVLERADSFKWGMRLIPWYFALTASILALFIVVEAPTAPSLEEFGAGNAAGIVLGVFFGVLLISYVFFIPFLKRKLVHKDARLRIWHVPLGPLLMRENPPLYFAGKADGEYVTNYYADAYGEVRAKGQELRQRKAGAGSDEEAAIGDGVGEIQKNDMTGDSVLTNAAKVNGVEEKTDTSDDAVADAQLSRKRRPEPYERFIAPVKELSWVNPQKYWGYFKFGMLQGVTRDVITHDSDRLRAIHARANRYDVRVEHMWTYCQVISAMMMSIAHGSNDVANAVGPWSAVYQTYREGAIATKSGTPIWMLIVAGLLLGLGFWFYGYHIMRAMGNKITQMSPTRGFATELGAAVTVLLASRLGLPVSTTQCLTGALIGTALMNYDVKAVNWRQLGFIFMGWVVTLPAAGLMAGLLCVMALNTPHF